jgi:hypothetical protein
MISSGEHAPRPEDQGVDATLVWALGSASVCAANQGDLERGVTLMKQALVGGALRQARNQDQTLHALFGVESAGLVAGRKGQALKSARLLGAVASLQETAGIAEEPRWQAAIEAMIAPAHAALGEEQWAVAFAAGRALTLEGVVAEALEESSPG